jgi:hypothetical protein
MPEHRVEPVARLDGIVHRRVQVQAGVGAECADPLAWFLVYQTVHPDDVVASNRQHAVVAYNDHEDPFPDGEGLETVQKEPECLIHALRGETNLGRVGAEAMSRLVKVTHIQGQEMGPSVGGQLQPGQDPVDTTAVGDLLIVWQ